MYNNVTLLGRLTRDPELRYTNGGKPVGNFTLAVERDYNTDEVDFIDIVVWNKLAKSCSKHLKKGQVALVRGSLQIRKSESNGKTYINPEVVAGKVKFL